MNTPLPATIVKASTLVDNTTRIVVDCQEMLPEYMTELFQLKGKLGWFFFHEQPIKEIDISQLPKIVLDKNEKSPSERLRASLFVLHTQSGGKPEDFDAYYRRSMEKFIQAVKEKLT